MWWSSSSGHIELNITKEHCHVGSHSGQCDNDITYLRKMPYIKRQLNKIKPSILACVLKEYGAWDEMQLANHEDNLDRILWIACGDILDELTMKGK